MRDLYITDFIFSFLPISLIEKFASLFSRFNGDLKVEKFPIPHYWQTKKDRLFSDGIDYVIMGHFHTEWFDQKNKKIPSVLMIIINAPYLIGVY